MINHYLKTAWRNLMKNKMFSFINIMGLTIGITVCMLIFLFIRNEFSADNFHKNGDNIYRVIRNTSSENKEVSVSYLSGPYAPALKADFPGEITKTVRVRPSNHLVSLGERSFNEKKTYDVDDNFFQVFTFPLIKGNPNVALKNPNSVVLTESTATKYFGDPASAMGKTIELDKDLQLKVTGIAEDVPSNSHLDFDLLVPISNYDQQSSFDVWINNSLYTYVELAPGITEQQIENRLPAFMDKHMGKDMKQFGFNFSLSLMPLSDVYLAKTDYDSARHGDKTVIYIFLSIAILILLIACINFMNLSTVRAVDRSKEVGLRKVLGAFRSHLIFQFIGESVIITFISCLLAVGILLLVMPLYNQLLGYNLTISWNTPPIYMFLSGIILVVGILAGCYPAFYLSGFSPVQAIKGKLNLGNNGVRFRQSLVIVQFIITVLLILGTMVIIKQMNFIKNKQLGYDKDQTMVVRIDNADIYQNRIRFKKSLESEPGVSSVSLMSGEPGGFFDTYFFNVEGQNEKWSAHTEFSDFQYVKTLGLHIVAGRDFSSNFPTDSTNAVLINQTAAAKLGWSPQQAIGKWIQNTSSDKQKRIIVGVVGDFSFESLRQSVTPLVISPGDDHRLALIKLNGGNIPTTIDAIKKDYAAAAPVYPFDYNFLNEQFNEMYRKDIRQQTILSIFAGLAILIASLGLFGLATFTTSKRTKEIGVRKVLGSSVIGIVILLSKDLLRPVLIAMIIAIPLGYIFMEKWLQSFAFRTPLYWWIFALAAIFTFGISLFTVGIKALKAGRANPVKSLKTE